MRKKLFYMVLGGIVFTTLSVLAYTLSSGEVLYETEEEITDINSNGYTDIKDALDDLYEKCDGGGSVPSFIFNTCGGNNIDNQETDRHFSSSFPTATRDGYTFLGWYTSETGGTRITEDTVITSDMTVYAHWVHTTVTAKGGVNYFTEAQEILYNPKTRQLCDTVGTTTPGQMSDCMRWWAYSEKDGIVNMILDHNIAIGIKWYDSSSGDNTHGPTTVLSALKYVTDNAAWTTTVQGNFATYTYSGTYGTYYSYPISYTINYASEGYKARLITAQEVAYITGNDSWSESSSSSSQFYFGSLNTTDYSNQTTEQKAKQRSYHWLFDNLYNCSSYGCTYNSTVSATSGNNGYWTSSAQAGVSSDAWCVGSTGTLFPAMTRYTYYGIRQVITVPVSEIFS